MRDIYEKLNEADENYAANVEDVTVNVMDLDSDIETSSPDSVQMSFDIDIEFRSWGIKDISIIPRGRVNFEIEATDVDDKVVDTIEVDFDFAEVDWRINWQPGSGYAIESLEVEVNRDGTVRNVVVNVYYPSHRKPHLLKLDLVEEEA